MFGKAKPGYIYLMRLEENLDPLQCAYKIGKSKEVGRRQKQVGVVLPYDVTVIHTIAVSDMPFAESLLHSTFTMQRLNGEWFYMRQIDLDWFCALTSDDLDAPPGWND